MCDLGDNAEPNHFYAAAASTPTPGKPFLCDYNRIKMPYTAPALAGWLVKARGLSTMGTVLAVTPEFIFRPRNKHLDMFNRNGKVFHTFNAEYSMRVETIDTVLL
jgi:hypothetical protein